MTLMRVDLHTPAELSQSYVDAVDVELSEIDERVEQLRLEWMTLEDRRGRLTTLRTAHLAAVDRFSPPTTLAALVDDPDRGSTA